MLASQHSLASFKRHLRSVRFGAFLGEWRFWASEETSDVGFRKSKKEPETFLTLLVRILLYPKNKTLPKFVFNGDLEENDVIIFSHPKTHPFQQTSRAPRRGRAPGGFSWFSACFCCFLFLFRQHSDQENIHTHLALRFESLALSDTKVSTGNCQLMEDSSFPKLCFWHHMTIKMSSILASSLSPAAFAAIASLWAAFSTSPKKSTPFPLYTVPKTLKPRVSCNRFRGTENNEPPRELIFLNPKKVEKHVEPTTGHQRMFSSIK